ncbi:thiol-disulfide isomerase/thioredoxin [Mucilaginibacter gracilis]|uniref:Thiol-disulfide isomerase/thioredoxin n=1 Tax=Mucilaginibacter gracilis TaxID=423350 RepID=A0A495J2X2_9SPHI|nr:TlpA family protein disulfide reductase [Mucilaginibacter gracilis]RKR83325.1 thiol-disulfide isomerase/thioredoxin [Mucilaginibacter gracilis]
MKDMKSSIKKALLSAVFFLCLYGTYAQNIVPLGLKIGDQVPDSTFNNIVNYKLSSPKISDFKGKLIILDFWSTGCSSCLAAFPKMETLQRKFGDKIQIILLNSSERKDQILGRIQKYKKFIPGVGLSTLPTVYGDSKWQFFFPHSGVPYHVWINSKGKVLSMPLAYNTSEENIQKALDGEKPLMVENLDFKARQGYDAWKEGLIKPAHPSLKPIFYSSFFSFNNGMHGGRGEVIDTLNQTIRRFSFNRPILEFYELAFAGTNRMLVEVKNKSQFELPLDRNKVDSWSIQNLFSYEICVPLKDERNINQFMQTDLNRFFGNLRDIEGNIEKRPFNCYILIKTKDGLLKGSTSKEEKYIKSETLHKWVNYNMYRIPYAFMDEIDDVKTLTAFIDESGVNKDLNLKVDLEINTGDLKDLSKVRESLRKYGFDLLQETRLLDVLIIKDTKKNNN